MTGRNHRSAGAIADVKVSDTSARMAQPITWEPLTSSSSTCSIVAAGCKLKGLSSTELLILRRKQRKLQKDIAEIEESVSDLSSHHARSLASTLIFAQEAAGTAVCISASGIVLTCAHCIAEDEEDYAAFDSTWLLYYTGEVVRVKCVIWDPVRDLALLQIVELEMSGSHVEAGVPKFSYVPLSMTTPKVNETIYCIGQPGRDDLESKTARKTTYNLVEISHGKYRGLIPGSDPQDNSEIGSLKHNAWTYWGHSGAPLIASKTGELFGLHSSWDDQTCMRHGVPIVAVRQFLQLFLDGASNSLCENIREVLEPAASATNSKGQGSSSSDTIVLDD